MEPAKNQYRTPQPKPTKLPDGSRKKEGEEDITYPESTASEADVRENNRPTTGNDRPAQPDPAGPR
jgi:hypothetical protein